MDSSVELGRRAAKRAESRMLIDGQLVTSSSGAEFDNHSPATGLLLGTVAAAAFYMDHRQFEAWKHTQLILDVGAGEPEGFSLAAGPDLHFITRSRVFGQQELAVLAAGERT